MSLETTDNTTTRMAKHVKYWSWKKHMMCNMMRMDLYNATIDSDEIHVDSAMVTYCTEAYIVLQVPAIGQHITSYTSKQTIQLLAK